MDSPRNLMLVFVCTIPDLQRKKRHEHSKRGINRQVRGAVGESVGTDNTESVCRIERMQWPVWALYCHGNRTHSTAHCKSL